MQAVQFFRVRSSTADYPRSPPDRTHGLRQRRATRSAPDPDGVGALVAGAGPTKHAIKRVDRLLGNPHLQSEQLLFYWAMLRALLGTLEQPLILVDWSPINAEANLFLLSAASPLAGRTFPVYERVHDRKISPQQQRVLLDALESLLPTGCVPVLVTDAGFRRPWFQAVEARGWQNATPTVHKT